MTNPIEPFNPAKVMDAIRDKIRGEFAALVPPEAWTKMVKDEIDSFFTLRRPAGLWGNDRGDPSSPFRKIVYEEIEKVARAKLNAALNAPELQSTWDGNGYLASDALKKIIIECAPAILTSIISARVQEMIQEGRF